MSWADGFPAPTHIDLVRASITANATVPPQHAI